MKFRVRKRMSDQSARLKKAIEVLRLAEEVIAEFKKDHVSWGADNLYPLGHINVFFADSKEEADSILEKAQKIVYERAEEKERQYGDPVESFKRASVMASILCNKEISAEDIVKVQMSLKLSRESYCHKEDNLLDLVGYTSILNDLENEKVIK
jgi:hypothetical protein